MTTLKDEFAADRLLEQDAETAWRAARNHNGCTTAQMVARNARDRGAVESQYDSKDFARRWRTSSERAS